MNPRSLGLAALLPVLFAGCEPTAPRENPGASAEAETEADLAGPDGPDLVPGPAPAKAQSPALPADDEDTKPAAGPDGARSLFDGESLGKWKVIEAFAGPGEVEVIDGHLVIGMGESLTGVVWEDTGDAFDLPLVNYEISMDAQRLMGTDFFCGLTFPVRDTDTSCTFIVGGWGGGVVGISSIDRLDASENETASYHRFDEGTWYHIRLQVHDARFKAFIDDKLVLNTLTSGRQLGMRFGDIEYSAPLGLTTYQTKAALKNIKIRPLTDEEIAEPAPGS